jgi:lysophospholipase L1-like esterase
MAIFGGILIVIGIILFFVQKNYSTKLQSIRLATSSTVAELQQIASEIAGEIGGGNLREYVKVSGVIRSDRPLMSELKQAPCVHYTMRVVREYEEERTTRDGDGKTRTETSRGSETVSSNSQSIPFTLQDKSGELVVYPDGGNIETVQILDEFRRENSGSSISFGGFSLAIGAGIGGNKIYDLYLRHEEDVIAKKPQIVIIYIGINDVWHKTSSRTGTDADKFERFYNALIKKIQKSGSQVVICTPTVIGEKHDHSNENDGDLNAYSAIIKKIAETNACKLIDLRKAFMDYEVKNNVENKASGILTTDRVHLNEAGNKFLAETMWETIKNL